MKVWTQRDEYIPLFGSHFGPEILPHCNFTVSLKELLGSEKGVGLESTIFDPDLDPDGSLAGRFTDAIVAGFAGLTGYVGA